MPLRTIVVPTDFSSNAAEAFTLAREMATAFGAKIILVHVRDIPLMPAPPLHIATPTPATMDGEIRAAIAEGLAKAEAAIGPDLVAECRSLDGRPHHEICKFADDVNADLIIISTRGQSGIARVMMGSTAERVVRGAHCPVLTVRSGEAAS